MTLSERLRWVALNVAPITPLKGPALELLFDAATEIEYLMQRIEILEDEKVRG